MKHVVMFSGGVGSWAAAKRVAAEYGTNNMTLLFADTKMEDEDLYRFLTEAANNVGACLEIIADGRTPWQVFKDEKFIGNSRIDPCSKILKRHLLDRWCNEHCDHGETVYYVGIDWTEEHRFEGQGKKPGLRRRMAECGKVFKAPMCDKPLVSKMQMLRNLVDAGIQPPKLYSLGFPHNNCGGFCIKAGHAQFAHLLKVLPERYAFHEAQENDARRLIGTEATILRDRRGGESRWMSLKEFRERLEGGSYSPKELHGFDWGGCGCAIE